MTEQCVPPCRELIELKEDIHALQADVKAMNDNIIRLVTKIEPLVEAKLESRIVALESEVATLKENKSSGANKALTIGLAIINIAMGLYLFLGKAVMDHISK